MITHLTVVYFMDQNEQNSNVEMLKKITSGAGMIRKKQNNLMRRYWVVIKLKFNYYFSYRLLFYIFISSISPS